MTQTNFNTMLEIKKAMKNGQIAPSRAQAEIANFRLDKGDSAAAADFEARHKFQAWMKEMRGL